MRNIVRLALLGIFFICFILAVLFLKSPNFKELDYQVMVYELTEQNKEICSEGYNISQPSVKIIKNIIGEYDNIFVNKGIERVGICIVGYGLRGEEYGIIPSEDMKIYINQKPVQSPFLLYSTDKDQLYRVEASLRGLTKRDLRYYQFHIHWLSSEDFEKKKLEVNSI